MFSLLLLFAPKLPINVHSFNCYYEFINWKSIEALTYTFYTYTHSTPLLTCGKVVVFSTSEWAGATFNKVILFWYERLLGNGVECEVIVYSSCLGYSSCAGFLIFLQYMYLRENCFAMRPFTTLSVPSDSWHENHAGRTHKPSFVFDVSFRPPDTSTMKSYFYNNRFPPFLYPINSIRSGKSA